MKLIHIVGAVFLLAGAAAAQDGGKNSGRNGSD